jgi:hypothetical protein
MRRENPDCLEVWAKVDALLNEIFRCDMDRAMFKKHNISLMRLIMNYSKAWRRADVT